MLGGTLGAILDIVHSKPESASMRRGERPSEPNWAVRRWNSVDFGPHVSCSSVQAAWLIGQPQNCL
jgi:hypothetical protein